MKFKQKMKCVNISNEPKVLGIKRGRVRLELHDAHTGKVEVVEDHNMQTNGIQAMLANCGWLNRSNFDGSNLVEQLLGGVALFDDEITESASNITPPAELKMTANASVGTTNSSDPTELGSYNGNETRWLDADTYQAVYEWNTSQGNGTIASLGATGKDMGYVGWGNALSEAVATVRNLNLVGNATEYTVKGIPARISLTDSDLYTFAIDPDNSNKAIIRHYLLPITKVNLAGKTSDPWLIEQTSITIPSGLYSYLGTTDSTWAVLLQSGHIQSVDGHLMILNRASASATWGTDFTQYLWDVDISNGTVSESTLLNTSGVTLHCIDYPVWLSKDQLAWVNGGYDYYHSADGRTVYSMIRTSGTWGTIQSCTNPLGSEQSNYGDNCGWNGRIYTGGGRAFVKSNSGMVMFDIVANKCYATNGTTNLSYCDAVTDAPMIRMYGGRYDTNVWRVTLYRSQFCIATIFNLTAPVVKTNAKSMKLIYTFEFGEEE